MRLAFPALWLATLLFLLMRYATPAPAWHHAFDVLALAGWAWCALREREALEDLLAEHRWPLAISALFVIAIHAAGMLLEAAHPERIAIPQPPQAGLLLCLAPLALFLRDVRLARMLIAVLIALCAWHAIALPLEAIAGLQFTWHPVQLRPREVGLLQNQAAGLAWQAYFFPGLFMGAFYLAWGAVAEERVFGDRTPDAKAWLALSLLWALAVACVQSRSALAGALAAALLGVIVYSGRAGRKTCIAAGILALAGALLFWMLFAQNKSGPGLRWAYLLLYLRRAFDSEWLWTGRGYTLEPDPAMQVPGLQYVDHAHNDFAQVFFTWGLPAVLAWGLFWLALLRLVARKAAQGLWWPLLALLAVGPSFVTDLGFHHFEKAGFIALFAAMMMALPAQVRRPDSPPR